jgi:hypothetical protein
MIVAIPLLIKEARQSSNTIPISSLPESEEVFATFSFADEEWKQVHQQEFIEDQKGKGTLDRFSGVIKYDSIVRDKKAKEIFFTPQSIYISDGKEGKLYKLNQLNSAGNGIHLNSIRLLNLSPLKKIQVKINVDSINDNLNRTNFDLEYLVPIPRSVDEKIDEILKNY